MADDEDVEVYEFEDDEAEDEDEETEDGSLFRGAYIDGPNVDLIDWCGLDLSDDERDRLWEEFSPHGLIEVCSSMELELDEEIDDAPPGLNDTYYSVYGDEDEAKEELRSVILGILGKEDTESDA